MGRGSKPVLMGKTLKRLRRPSLAGEFVYFTPLMVKPWGPMFN